MHGTCNSASATPPVGGRLKRDASLKAGAAGDASQAAFRTCRGRRLTTRRKYKDASPSFLFDVSAASRDLLWDSEISGSRERLLLPQKTAGKLRLHFRPTWGWGVKMPLEPGLLQSLLLPGLLVRCGGVLVGIGLGAWWSTTTTMNR